MTESTTLTVRLKPETRDRLEALAKDTRRSKAFIAAEAIACYLDAQAWQLERIKAGIADADAGRVVAHEKVMAWVESWGTDNELPPPECE
jgi:predicted transcriptional regulator